jgi:hypothetical protein
MTLQNLFLVLQAFGKFFGDILLIVGFLSLAFLVLCFIAALLHKWGIL